MGCFIGSDEPSNAASVHLCIRLLRFVVVGVNQQLPILDHNHRWIKQWVAWLSECFVGSICFPQHGSNTTQQNRTEQTEQNRTEQNTTEQNRTEQNRLVRLLSEGLSRGSYRQCQIKISSSRVHAAAKLAVCPVLSSNVSNASAE